MVDYLKLGTRLRSEGVNTEVFLEQKKLGSQMKYANRKGIPFVILADSSDLDLAQTKVRNMETGDQTSVKISELCEFIGRPLLADASA